MGPVKVAREPTGCFCAQCAPDRLYYSNWISHTTAQHMVWVMNIEPIVSPLVGRVAEEMRRGIQ